MDNYSIRKAGAADVTLIHDLAWQIWPVAYRDILSDDQITYMLHLLYNEEKLLEQIEQQVTFIIASEKLQPVGFASFSLIRPAVYKLHKLYVLPSQQGKGTGRFVIDYLEKFMSSAGAGALHLNVNRQNSAKKFYEKLGFTVIDEEDTDIGNGYFMNDFVMEKLLSQQKSHER